MTETTTLSAKFDEVTELSYRVATAKTIDPERKVIVDGTLSVDQWFVPAKEVIFKPNSRLVFSGSAVTKRRELFVVAERITVEGGTAAITWEKVAPPPPADRGQAASGTPGGGEGGNGAPGAEGSVGAEGLQGAAAPNFALFVQTLAGAGNLQIDFAGGPGGQGGLGQRGGDGGAGAKGGPARQARQGGPFGSTIWLPYCESGPGQGGNGGGGGRGGNGGVGGKGGAGGTITICSDTTRIPVLRQAINIVNDGGPGGPGGPAGSGGSGGAAGPEGDLANFCNSAGRNGSGGPVGGPGVGGPAGGTGRQGVQFDCYITDDEFRKLFGYGT